MFALKSISRDSIPAALAKAERYRFLNEPAEAESICRDILQVEPDHHEALITLILAFTEQFADDPGLFADVRSAIRRLSEPYERAYYGGLACERRAKTQYRAGGFAAHDGVHEWILEAMSLFREAEALRPQGNDDAILRWNACARFLASHKDVTARKIEELEPILSE